MSESVERTSVPTSERTRMTPQQRRNLMAGVAICGDGDVYRHVVETLKCDGQVKAYAPPSGPFGAF